MIRLRTASNWLILNCRRKASRAMSLRFRPDFLAASSKSLLRSSSNRIVSVAVFMSYIVIRNKGCVNSDIKYGQRPAYAHHLSCKTNQLRFGFREGCLSRAESRKKRRSEIICQDFALSRLGVDTDRNVSHDHSDKRVRMDKADMFFRDIRDSFHFRNPWLCIVFRIQIQHT